MVKNKGVFFKDRNLLKIAAWSGVAVIILNTVIPIFMKILGKKILDLSICYSILTLILMGLFFYGLVVLGKRYKNKLLQIMGYLFILYYLFAFFMSSSGYVNTLYGDIEEFDKEELSGDEKFIKFLKEILKRKIISFLIFGLPLVILSILLGIEILKLRKRNVKHAKVTGVLDIVGGATIFLGIGYLVLMVSSIFKIIIFFNESKK